MTSIVPSTDEDVELAHALAELYRETAHDDSTAILLVRPRVMRRLIRWKQHRDPESCDTLTWPIRAGIESAEELFITLETPATEVLYFCESDWYFSYDASFEKKFRFYARLLGIEAVDRFIAQQRPSDDEIRREIAQIGPRVWDETAAVLESERILCRHETLTQLHRKVVPWLVDTLNTFPLRAERFLPILQVDSIGDWLNMSAYQPIYRSYVDAANLVADSRSNPDLQLETAQARGAGGIPANFEEDIPNTGNVVRDVVAAVKNCRRTGVPIARRRRAIVQRLTEQITRPLCARLNVEFQAEEWAEALFPFVPLAAKGFWTRAARGLYELQRLVKNTSSRVEKVNPYRWLFSFGRKSVRVELQFAEITQRLRRYQKALKHFQKSDTSPSELRQLSAFLEAAIRCSDRDAREAFLEPIRTEFMAAGIVPQNLAERTALAVIADELVDLVHDRGYVRFSDVRDAIARNAIKLPDLQSVVQLLTGDQLLQLDQKLGKRLRGVYKPGEIYMRFIQRGTSIAFGTWVGRMVSKYLLFPFGGAFLIVEFARYLYHESVYFYGYLHGQVIHIDKEPLSEGGRAIIIAFTIGVGFLLLGLIHSQWIRSIAEAILDGISAVFMALFVRLPRFIWQQLLSPILYDSYVARLTEHYFLLPLLLTGVGLGIAYLNEVPRQDLSVVAGVCFVVGLVFARTPQGQQFKEVLLNAVTDTVRAIHHNLIRGLIAFIRDLFRKFQDWFDQALYSIDEWLHYKSWQSTSNLYVKVFLLVFWMPIEYTVRFAFNLLLEPQLNPLKHFPVVTVSHKLLLPMIPSVVQTTGLNVESVTLIIACIPGIFGFIVWELKENWRLYESNRPKGIQPAVMGHHGETMRGYLLPRFHSGTVPKLYREIRKKLRKEARTGNPVELRDELEKLRHVRESIEDVFDREIRNLIQQTTTSFSMELEEVTVCLQSIHLRLRVGGVSPTVSLVLALVDTSIVASFNPPEPECYELLKRESQSHARIFEAAIAGLCQMFDAEPPVELSRTTAIGSWDDWKDFWDRRGRKVT